MISAPPRPSSPAEREALIREARARQRRRRLVAATGIAVAAAAAMAAHALLGLGATQTASPSRGDGQPACGQGCGTNLPAEMLAVTSVYYQHGSFFGNGLLRVDPKTLRPLPGPALRLGDAVTTEVPSPDGDQVALGGFNMGEILFADRSLRGVSRLTLVHHSQRRRGVSVDVEAWPRPSRLTAVATVGLTPWWAPKSSVLFVVNPVSRRVILRLPLHGTVGDAVSVRDGTTALVVDRGRDARIVVVTPGGSTWSRSLRGLDLAGGKGVRVNGTTYLPNRDVSLATDGRDRVFAVAADRPIGELRLHERELRYHRVALPKTYFSYPRPQSPGTGGVELRLSAGATWFGHGQLGISSADELPTDTAGGTWNRYASRKLEIVDTRTWRLLRTVDSSGCAPDGTVILCSGRGIIAYDSSWDRIWAKPSTESGWTLTAGRLLAWQIVEMSSPRELNPATGRALRRIEPVVTNSDGDSPTLIPLRPRG